MESNIKQVHSYYSLFTESQRISSVSQCNVIIIGIEFVSSLCNQFLKFEAEAKALSEFVNEEYSDLNKRRAMRKLTNGERQAENLSASEKSRIRTFYVIINKLVVELKKRSEAYNFITNLFEFSTQLLFIDGNELELSAKKLVAVYQNDLSEDLLIELKQFLPRVKLQALQVPGFFSNRTHENFDDTDKVVSPVIVFNWLIENAITPVFPDVYTAYKLLVTIPIANCKTEL